MPHPLASSLSRRLARHDAPRRPDAGRRQHGQARAPVARVLAPGHQPALDQRRQRLLEILPRGAAPRRELGNGLHAPLTQEQQQAPFGHGQVVAGVEIAGRRLEVFGQPARRGHQGAGGEDSLRVGGRNFGYRSPGKRDRVAHGFLPEGGSG